MFSFTVGIYWLFHISWPFLLQKNTRAANETKVYATIKQHTKNKNIHPQAGQDILTSIPLWSEKHLISHSFIVWSFELEIKKRASPFDRKQTKKMTANWAPEKSFATRIALTDTFFFMILASKLEHCLVIKEEGRSHRSSAWSKPVVLWSVQQQEWVPGWRRWPGSILITSTSVCCQAALGWW